jgi:DNA repair protein RecO (recombination protein O)
MTTRTCGPMATNDGLIAALPVAQPAAQPAAKKTKTSQAGKAPAVSRASGLRAAVSRPAPLLAYVLHSYDWSESSLIVDLFTRTRGRLVAVARGAKKPHSGFRPVLLPFQPLHAQLGKAPADEQSELHLLRGAEWVGGTPLLNSADLLPGYYVNELLMRLLAREDPHPRLFDAYANTISALAGQGGGLEEGAALRAFELLLLRELGWLPELNVATLTAQPVQADGRYTLHPEAGLVAQADGLLGARWRALQVALDGGDARELAALRAACAPVAPALRGPLRTLLHYHLGSSTLRTRQVWQGVQRLADVRQDPVHPTAHHPV